MKLSRVMLYIAVGLSALLPFSVHARTVIITDAQSGQNAGINCRQSPVYGLQCWYTQDVPASDTINLAAPMVFFLASNSDTHITSTIYGTINVSNGASVQVADADVTIASGGVMNLLDGNQALVIYGDQGVVSFRVSGTVNVAANAAIASRLEPNGGTYTHGYVPPFLDVEKGGTINNSGRILTDGSSSTWAYTRGPSVINNSGTINNKQGAVITTAPGAQLNNKTGGKFINSGTIQIGYGATGAAAVTTASLTNQGELFNNGTIDNGQPGSQYKASVVDQGGGIIAGTGTISGPGAQQNLTVITPAKAPTNLQATAADRSVSLTWKAPVDNGGGAISSYTVVMQPGNRTQACQNLSCTITNIANGTTYTFSVIANNIAGQSPSSPTVRKTPPFNHSITFKPDAYSYAPNVTHSTDKSWTVPLNVSMIRVTAVGGGGANGQALDGNSGGAGGSGAKVQTPVMDVSTSEVISMTVGAVGGDCTSVQFESNHQSVNVIAGGGGGGGGGGNTGGGASGGNGGQNGSKAGGNGQKASDINDTNMTGRVGGPGYGGNGSGGAGSGGASWSCKYQGKCTETVDWVDGQPVNNSLAGAGGTQLQCYKGGITSGSGGAGGAGFGGGGAAGDSSSTSGYGPGESGGGAGGSTGPQNSVYAVAGNGNGDGYVVIEY